VEFELTDEGIELKQHDMQIKHPWSEVKKAANAPDGIEIVYKKGGLAVVRARAFQTEEEQRGFYEEIKKRIS